jgi:hypothetical protein
LRPLAIYRRTTRRDQLNGKCRRGKRAVSKVIVYLWGIEDSNPRFLRTALSQQIESDVSAYLFTITIRSLA